MKTIKLLAAVLFLALLVSFTQDKPAYLLYSKDAKLVKYKSLLKEAQKADVVFFGELHNNPISHWLQYELTKDLIESKADKIILGAEMFEADNQIIVDEYLSGMISERKFEAECRLWPNYETDYKPLMTLAKSNGVPFIATNIPRRYASVVFNNGLEGLDALSNEAKQYIAPLPIAYDPNQDAYKSMMNMEGMPAHVSPKLPMAQASKDATMAHFIHKNYKKNHTFVHYQGAYHSDKYQGIIYYLNQYHPNLKILTISTVLSSNLSEITVEEKAKADYIIVVDENMTSTH